MLLLCRVCVVMVMMLVMGTGGSLAIPSRVANRMIPSWWINARAQQACAGRGDCGPDECCVRPMLAANAYCIKYSDEGHSCDPSAMLVDMENEVYFDHCPCFSHLTCVNFRYNSRCVNPDTLSLLTGHRFAPVPNPVQIGDPIPVPKQTQGM